MILSHNMNNDVHAPCGFTPCACALDSQCHPATFMHTPTMLPHPMSMWPSMSHSVHFTFASNSGQQQTPIPPPPPPPPTPPLEIRKVFRGAKTMEI